MKLIDLIDNIDEVGNNLVIYTQAGERLHPDIYAITGLTNEYVQNEKPPEGLDYFLEVELAKEAIQVWQTWRNGKSPNKFEKYQAVVYYAEHDAYLPADN